MGGGGRSDINGLLILRPVGVIATLIGLWGLTREQVRAHRFLFLMAGAIFALVVVQLIPLPPTLWHALPGRALVAQIDQVALNQDIWRPLTMTPFATWNAFFSLFIPLAVLVLGVQLTREHHVMLLSVVLALSAVSGLLGLLQVIGSAESSLYFYEVTNAGAAVGLFANRNHQAIFLSTVFPMLAVFAYAQKRGVGQSQIKIWLAIGGAALLVPLLLVTGSRSGLLLGMLGLGVAAILSRQASVADSSGNGQTQPKTKKTIRYAIATGALVVIALVTALMSRAEAITRLLDSDEMNGARLPMWKTGWDLLFKYFPTGSGFGSITTVFEIDQPKDNLAPTYVNHLHNDWLETLVLGGLPAGLLMIIAAVAWSRATIAFFGMKNASGRDLLLAKLGSIVTLIFVVASFVDYPLRTPSIACVFVLAAVWLSRHDPRSAKYAA